MPFVIAALVALVATAAVACGDNEPKNSTQQLHLVFPRSTATDIEFVAVVREVPGDADARRALDLLVEGPTESEIGEFGVLDAIPAGTMVRSLTIAGGVATADFTSEILAFGGGSANVIAITGAIERTLLAQAGVASVVILVDGKPDAIQP